MAAHRMRLHKALRAIVATSVLVFTSVLAQQSAPYSFRPKAGFVPDQITALKIAEAVWLPIYGAEIYNKRPFTAKLKGDVWVVEGTLPEDMLGGVPLAEISRVDGRVIRVSHGR
jgi:hypothetical protein